MEYPKCHTKLLWGYPTPEAMKLIEQGKLIACGCVLMDKNYCPVCGALVWESKAKPRSRRKRSK